MVPFVAFIVLQPRPSGQYEAELKRMVAEDQADRQFQGVPTKAEEARMSRNDAVRLRRVRQILREAREFNAEEFDAAALLFQHASIPDDFVVAHELAVCANALGKIGSMPALSEDRYLVRIGRKQRFGSQFKRDGKTLDPVDEILPTAVTDDLRLSMLVPPLAAYREHGPMAFRFVTDVVFARIEKRRDPSHPLVGDPVASPKLAEIRPSSGTRSAVLRFYQEGRIVTTDDYANAARILLSSPVSEELLLAHEFVVLAMGEGNAAARRLFASTWDAFAVSIGQPVRYAKLRESQVVRRVLAGSS